MYVCMNECMNVCVYVRLSHLSGLIRLVTLRGAANRTCERSVLDRVPDIEGETEEGGEKRQGGDEKGKRRSRK